MFLIILLAVILIPLCAGCFLFKKQHTNSNTVQTNTSVAIEDDTRPDDYINKYQKKYLLTKNEWYEYRKLKKLAESKGLQVCPKVRLLDLIEPRRGDPKYKALFYKIQAKHVDFVICDQDLYVQAILELDDNSHNQIARKERDNFVDTILKDVGYLVIRTRSITETTLNMIDKTTPDL